MGKWVFVTKTPNPKDIDFVTFIESDIVDKHRIELKKFLSNNSMLALGLDPYIIEVHKQNSPSYFKYESDKAYWTNKFDKTRRDRTGRKNPKGFLEIIY